MSSSESAVSCNSYNSNVPTCGCSRPIKMWVANTVKNRNRKFWKCRNAGMDNSCDLFAWDDEITPSEQVCKHCKLAKMKNELVEAMLEKTKVKQAHLKRRISQLKVMLVMSWIVMGVLYTYM
ncbi:uncharacterized protein LOC131614713 [Vicia villosa]|uniref:uncharacterized protein LOC131614713 n=1 Tax=Vicia villosa TaxID=3911 RepID=UPI00273BC670|nr:uncharacterized protein LOC131614713 [Vicia villosa]